MSKLQMTAKSVLLQFDGDEWFALKAWHRASQFAYRPVSSVSCTCVEQSCGVQQGVDDERRVPGGFQTVPRDELCHVPGR